MTINEPARDPISIAVTETSQVGEVRRAATALAKSMDFDEVQTGQIAIVVTELAANVLRHAKAGEMILRSLINTTTRRATGLEILAIDRGPGIANLNLALADGFSTGSTPGTGLGAVKRLSTFMDAYSEPSGGTVVVAQFQNPSAAREAMDIGAVCLLKPGEEACGDSWAAFSDAPTRTVIFAADGLGHGVDAAVASRLAIDTFRQNLHLESEQIAAAVHAAMRSTRGAAIAVVEILRNRREIHFTGIGNFSALLLHETASRNMLSHNGTAGVEARHIQSFSYPWSEKSLLILHSDGLASQWNLLKHPGLRVRHPSLIAGLLYRDFRRQRDDVSVVVARDATQ